MYLEFYGLKEKPFNLTPSPRFLYLGESHREALSLLTYGILEHKGFILLTGEVGSGKTTIVHALLSALDENVTRVHLSNPLLSSMDFINYLGHAALKRKTRFDSKSEFLLEFEEFLRHLRQHQRSFVLIIDEAQKLSFALLEEIRLLSNMESAEEKLINIFLVGQPELNDKLSQPRCRPLLQRISIRHHISPLSQAETREYVNTRLKAAGVKDDNEVLSNDVVKAIHQYSRGYPRMINILADNCLLLGFSREARKITTAMVKECYEDLQLEGSTLKAAVEQPGSVNKAPGSVAERRPLWRWVVIAFLLGMVIATLVFYGVGGFDNLATTFSNSRTADPNGEAVDKMVVRKKLPDHREAPKGLEERVPGSEGSRVPGLTDPSNSVASSEAILERSDPNAYPREAILERSDPNAYRHEAQRVVVKEKDTLALLAVSVYGRMDKGILRLIQRHNPELEDVDRIYVGQKILFPPLEAVSGR